MSDSYYPTLKEVTDKLGARKHQGYYMAQCPAHDDTTASLSIAEKRGRIVFKCHAGCSQDAVMEGLRRQKSWPERKSNGTATPQRTIVSTYNYEDQNGDILFQAVRLAPKSFYQRRPDGKGGWINNITGVPVVPYRLAEVEEGIALGREIWIVEGEKDADNLAKLGFRATCNPAGAGKWKAEHAAFLKGADCIVIPDNDEPGRKHAASVAASLKGIAARVRILALPDLPEKGDVSDWLAAGGQAEQLLKFADAAPDCTQKKKPRVEKAKGDNYQPEHWQLEPWPEHVDGHTLLDELVATFRRYLVLPPHAAEALALWVAHGDLLHHPAVGACIQYQPRCDLSLHRAGKADVADRRGRHLRRRRRSAARRSEFRAYEANCQRYSL
jgi:hypothetical protein